MCCKTVVVDANGNYREYHTVFSHKPVLKIKEMENILFELIEGYCVDLSVENGTASEEINTL
jgi:transcriptional accessory protein Tex/SPT6